MFANSLFVLASASIDIDATVAFQMGLFIALLVIMNPLLIQPYLKAMDARREGLEGSKEDAEEFDIRAEKALAEYEKKMRDARREAQDIRDSLKNQGAFEHTELIEDARTELATKIEGERVRVAAEREDALTAMSGRADALAGFIVTKVLPQA